MIVSTREKKGIAEAHCLQKKISHYPLQENIVRPLKQTPIANRVIL